MSRRIVSIGRYLGGKVAIAHKLLPYLGHSCRLYHEPCMGFFTLGLNVNHPIRMGSDLNWRTYNLLTVIQDHCEDLVAAIHGSPREPDALKQCWEQSPDPLEDARRYYWVSVSTRSGAGGRWSSGVSSTRAPRCRRHRASHLYAVSDRLQGVELRHTDGLVAARQVDSPRTLFYFDPTYENSVRGAKDNRHADQAASLTRNQYLYETDQGALLSTVLGLTGMVVLSGYPNPLYDNALEGWETVDFPSFDLAGNQKTERLWLNPQAWSKLPTRQLHLEELTLC
jgi:DNA adenine methylase